MKYHLEEEYEYDFELFGISTHEKDYRLCWAINNSLKISLERTSEDVELIFRHQKEKYGKFRGKFHEMSRNFLESSSKFPGNFPEKSRTCPEMS